MFMTSIIVTNSLLPYLLSKAIGNINSAKKFQIYHRHFELVEKYHTNLKKNFCNKFFYPEFYGYLEYKLRKIIGNPNFSDISNVNRFKRAWYSFDIKRQTACLVFNPIQVEGYAALFSCTSVVQASDSMTTSM